jgi:hypothetical protein
MARKLALVFGFNCGVRPFYAACCFDVLSRGSVLCLLNASFETAISQRHNSIFYAEINDHDVRRGDTGQILTQWRRLMASRVALDLLLWAMRSVLYRLIRMAIEMASEVGAFVRCHRLYVLHKVNHVFTFWPGSRMFTYVLDPESSQSLTSRHCQFPLPLPSDLAISIRTHIFSSPILVLETQNLHTRTTLAVSRFYDGLAKIPQHR